MDKVTRVFAGLSLCLALMPGSLLVGCDGASGVDKSPYVGTWQLAYGSDAGTTPEAVAMMDSYGIETTLVLNEDDTGTLDLFGEVFAVTWSASSDSEGEISLEGMGDGALQLDDSELTLVDSNGTSMTFSREEA